MRYLNLNWAQSFLVNDDLIERFKLDFEVFRKPSCSDVMVNLIIKSTLKNPNDVNFLALTFDIIASFPWDQKKFNIISKVLYDIFLNFKKKYQNFVFDSNNLKNASSLKFSLNLVAESILENKMEIFNIDFSPICEQLATLEFTSFSGFNVVLKTETDCEDEPVLGGICPRVQVLYVPNSFPETWSRDSLKIQVHAEAPENAYFSYDAIKKILDITCGMIQQKVYELPLEMHQNLNYADCYKLLINLPIQDQIQRYLSGLFNYFGRRYTIHEFLNNIDSEPAISGYFSPEVKSNQGLTMKILANIRASFLTLALSEGKLIRMYRRTSFIDGSQKLGLATPRINPIEKIIAEPFLDISGTGESGLSIVIYSNNLQINSTNVDINGNWATKVNLKNGSHQIQAAQICPNGIEIKSIAVFTNVRVVPKNLCDQLGPDKFIHDLVCLNAYLRYLLMKFNIMTVENFILDKDAFDKIGEKNFSDVINLLGQKQSLLPNN